MPSPFPGMNPYLEQNDVWEDFHGSFINHARDVLMELVGAHYFVKIVPLAVPLHLAPLAVDVEILCSLEIHDRRLRRVVTVLELLSPTNKASGPDRDDYLRKRNLLLMSPVNLVEIDLRRGGERPSPPVLPACDYYAMVARAQDWPQAGFWPIGLRERLPVIPIPVSPPDPEVPLDLQELLHRVYDAAGYKRYVYSDKPHPALRPADAEWAEQIARQQTAAGE